MTSKFQQSQVRPRLGGREREREGPRGPSSGQSPPFTPPDSPHRDRAGAGGLARVRVHCSERQPPRSVRGLPERRLPGWGLQPARACPRPQRPPSTALTPTPRRPRVLRELDTRLEQLWPSRASPDCMPKPLPKKLSSHATPATTHPGARPRWRPLGKLHVRSKASQWQPLPPGANLRERSGGLRFTEPP